MLRSIAKYEKQSYVVINLIYKDSFTDMQNTGQQIDSRGSIAMGKTAITVRIHESIKTRGKRMRGQMFLESKNSRAQIYRIARPTGNGPPREEVGVSPSMKIASRLVVRSYIVGELHVVSRES